MSGSELLWAAAGIAAAAAAAVLLWRGQAGARDRDPADRRAFRWLIVAAILLGGAFAADAFGGPLGGTAVPLTLGDVLALLALPPLVLSVAAMTSPADDEAAGQGRPARSARLESGPDAARRGTAAQIADGLLLATGLFAIAWVAVFGPAYGQADTGAGTFALDLVRPAADLLALAAAAQYAVGAGRRGLAVLLALAAAAAGDTLNVTARTAGTHPAAWTQIAWLASLCLLAVAALQPAGAGVLPGGWPARPGFPGSPAGRRPAPALAALAATTLAAVVLIGWAAAGGHQALPVLVVIAAIAVLALAARVFILLRRAGTVTAVAREAGRQFRELADRTSDVVLVCEPSGAVAYASPAVADYGYITADLAGQDLYELIHPEDQQQARAAALAALRAGGGEAGRLACRVRAADGTWRHVESTISPHRHEGSPASLLVTARDVSDEVALRRQVTHLTLHDGLTGLPNRAYLEERARDLLAGTHRPDAQAEPPDGVAGAIFLDLDGFTAVNDSVGHGAGDVVLAQAARRLRSAVPSRDIVARWGGDEFAVLIDRAASAQEIADMAERLAGIIAAEPFLAADREVTLTASVGVAMAQDSRWEHLLRNADVAMSRAKESGGSRVEMFAASMHADVVRRLEFATDLRTAIARGQLALEYQPVVSLATRQVAAIEALVRWPREDAAVDPAEFLGIAEDSGLIGPLGEWVLRQACRDAAAWRAAGWPGRLSVNFSRRQVTGTRFSQAVLEILAECGLPPGALILEVTERVLIEGSAPMMAGLVELRGRGVRLAIDDFGAGYASLAYLRQLPVDIIKIDPSFVAGLGTDAALGMLTKTIVSVGRDLGIEVVAEGIERPEQLAMLASMGCDFGQGYLIARPMPAGEVAATVRATVPGTTRQAASSTGPGNATVLAATAGDPATEAPAVL